MIALQILEGKTAEEIGIPQLQYQSRKETLEEFLQSWDEQGDFTQEYPRWLIDKQRQERREREERETVLAKMREQSQAARRKMSGTPPPEAESNEPELPPLADQARGMYETAKDVFKNRKHLFLDKATYEARYAVCQACDFLMESGRCGNTEDDMRGCGCFMKLKAKLKAAKCPRGYWKE